jgi:serine/threonine protein kinase
MLKGDKIGPYVVLKDFVVAGGMSKVSFVEKGGKEFFIKEFLSPKYPVEGSPGSVETLRKKRDRCNAFESHHLKLNRAISSKVSVGGNLVFAVDFFRAGTAYYKITEKIDISSLATNDINRLSLERIKIILKTATHSLKILHDLGIVHGDLKPDNILIKETMTGSFTTKLIDFDNSYFSSKPPANSDEVVGTPDYYSPELGSYIKSAGDRPRPDLTTKSDIFALGVIFTQYLTGSKPLIGTSHSYVWEAVQVGNPVLIEGKNITPKIHDLIISMLQLQPSLRPSISEIYKRLADKDLFDLDRKIDTHIGSPPPIDDEKPGLKGRGLDVKDARKVEDGDGDGKSILKGKGLKIARKS